MKKLSTLLTVLALLCCGVGCSMPRAPISGPIFTNVKDGMLVNPGPIPAEPKIGESMAVSFFGVTLGDSSIATARNAGGINRICFVDYESYGIFGVYSRTVTRVYGE